MNLLSRYSFIEAISHISSSLDPHHTLIYTEINQAPKVASLIQGIAAEEKLINAIQFTIYNRIKDLPNACMGKLGWEPVRHYFKTDGGQDSGGCRGLGKGAGRTIGRYRRRELLSEIDHRCHPPLSPEYKSPERVLAAVDEALFQARRTGNSIVKLIEHDDPILHNYYDSLPAVTRNHRRFEERGLHVVRATHRAY